MTKHIFLSSVIGVFLFSIIVYAEAQEQVTTTTIPPERRLEIEKERREVKEIRTATFETNQKAREDALRNAKEVRQGAKVDIEQTRKEALQKIQTIKLDTSATPEQNREAAKRVSEEVRQMLSQKREAAKQTVEETREAFQQKMEANRTAAKTQIETRREELKQKLTVIKDERKKATVENVGSKLQDINTRSLANFSETLNRIEELMQKVVTRADKAEVSGADVAQVRSDIESFKTALAAARSAIVTQTSKVYSITVVDEATLKANVEKARQTLQTDLKKVQDTVKAVREAARVAVTDLVKIPNINALGDLTGASDSTTSSTN